MRATSPETTISNKNRIFALSHNSNLASILSLFLFVLPAVAVGFTIHTSKLRPMASRTVAVTMTADTSPETVSAHTSANEEWSSQAYESSLSFANSLLSCQDHYLKSHLSSSLDILLSAYRTFGGSNLSRVIGSYNGGKDAVVVMHLMRAAHALYCERNKKKIKKKLPKPRMLYFVVKDEFEEVQSFVFETAKMYDMEMIVYDGSKYSFKEGLEELVNQEAEAEKDGTLAFVLGTRSTDPNAEGQTGFCPSSDWMPPFMRVNPVLDWDYGHVWHFLRLFDLPYCSLYDEGYTSLGKIEDTRPCPALRRGDGDENGYWPAYMLADWTQERAGRISKKVKQSAPKTLESASASDSEAASTSSSNGGFPPLVGLLIIGDEILKGQTDDCNIRECAAALRQNGVPLERVSVVPDDLDVIVAEIVRMEQEVDIVVTSGGVGPTHDDVTIKAVAQALGSPLTRHQGMLNCLRERGLVKDNNNEEAINKMTMLPRNGKLQYWAGKDEWPILQCNNLFVLPGVPQFFAAKIQAIAAHLASVIDQNICTNTTCRKVVLSIDENSIVTPLNEVVEKHPCVSIGSYPFVDHPECKTVVTLEGRECPPFPEGEVGGTGGVTGRILRRRMSRSQTFDGEEMDRNVRSALSDLISLLPRGSVLRVDNEDNLPSSLRKK